VEKVVRFSFIGAMLVYRHFGPKTLRHQCLSVRKTYRHWYQCLDTSALTVPKCLETLPLTCYKY